LKIRPVTAVWEVTMGCNMRCGHCGSSCEERLPDELATHEALFLARQISELGLKWITLSGGEPLLREDLPQIIREFVSHGVAVNIITNGWLIDAQKARTLKECGISTVAISIDGTEKIHDNIRKAGSFSRIREAASHLNESGVRMGAVTTVSNLNIDVLPEMSQILPEMGFELWQIQLGQPMGNFKERPDWIISPALVSVLLDFCYKTSAEGRIKIFPADCLGYYTEKEVLARQNSGIGGAASYWNGCNAGTRNFGILHNGDILGCTSIREKSFIEGNIRQKPLSEIWNDPEKFSWCRKMSTSRLVGDCADCIYKRRCLGGCPNTRLTMNGDIYSENFYCAYNFALKKLRERLLEEDDAAWLVSEAESCLAKKNFQTAAFFVRRALEIEPENKKALAISGFSEFFCGNFELCKSANTKALKLDPTDTYAMKGLGLALHELGDYAESIKLLEQAAKLTNYENKDILNDLEYVRRRCQTDS